MIYSRDLEDMITLGEILLSFLLENFCTNNENLSGIQGIQSSLLIRVNLESRPAWKTVAYQTLEPGLATKLANS